MTYDGLLFTPDIPTVKVVPAHPDNVMRTSWPNGQIEPKNNPKVIVLHTPEEPVDDNEFTPIYFSRRIFDAQGNQRYASTHYYQDSDGDLYQMVPEKYGAIANGVQGKPYPAGTDPTISLNYQSDTIEIEGYAAGMHRTCPPGSRQWDGTRNWIISCGLRKNIPIVRARVIGHYQVSAQRTDPGTLKIDQLVTESAEVADAIIRASETQQRAIEMIARVHQALGSAWKAGDFPGVHKGFHYIGIGL